ncbi:MAG: hypothetical protein QNJ64_16355 [Crocosphaera sp.]|nr:hypothetical protein [Crocosphaera sp.]
MKSCFIHTEGEQSECVCGEFKIDPEKKPCYLQLEGQSGSDFSRNVANQAVNYFQDSGILSLFVASALITFTISRFN